MTTLNVTLQRQVTNVTLLPNGKTTVISVPGYQGGIGPKGDKGDPGDAGTVTPESIGLGNVDNTSDVDKPISEATALALQNKVDKETGKGLSQENFTTTAAAKLEGIEEGAQVNVPQVAGIDLAIQFNDDGAFGGVEAFQYDRVSGSIKIGEGVELLPHNPLGISRGVDEALQVNLQNTGEFVNASSDYVVTADNGDNETFYGDFGINGSLYDNEDYSATEANDVYLASSDTNLVLGTYGVNKKVKIHTGGAKAENVDVEIDSSGLNLTTGRSFKVNGEGLLPSIDEDDFFSNSPNYVPTQQSTKSYVDAAIFAAGSYTDEQAQDAAGALITAGSKQAIGVTYDDENNCINFDARHNHDTQYAPVLTSEERYVTEAEKTTWNAKSDLALGETSGTAYRGDRGKTAYDHSQVAHASSDAEKNVQANWNEVDSGVDSFIQNKPSLLELGEFETTAYRGDRGVIAYNHSQATHAPSNAEANVQSNWNETNSGSDAYILNKPSVTTKTFAIAMAIALG